MGRNEDLHPGDCVLIDGTIPAEVIDLAALAWGIDRGEDRYKIKRLSDGLISNQMPRADLLLSCKKWLPRVRETMGVGDVCNHCEFQLSCLASQKG